MVTLDNVVNGVIKYMDTEIIPHLSGVKKIGLTTYVGLAVQNTNAMFEQYSKHPAIDILNVIDDENNIDIDKIYRSIAPMFADGHKELIKIPLITEFKIDKNDIEMMYKYITEG